MNFKHLLCFLLLFLLTSKEIISAFEVIYPQIPGLPTITSGSNPSEYITYFVGLSIILGVILALIFLVVGGIKFIISIDNPQTRKNALENVKNSILGLILLVGSFLILKTINPSLVEPILSPLSVEEGLFLSNGSNLIGAPMTLSDINNMPKDYKTLIYKCKKGTPLLIWKFPKKNFAGNDEKGSGIIVVRKKCGESENISSIGSYKILFETPGIYLCSGLCSTERIICNGNMSGPITKSTSLPEGFKDVPFESVYIVNQGEKRYSAVFLDINDPLGAGNCSQIYNLYDSQNYQDRICFDHKNDPSGSIFVFSQNYENPQEWGNGIRFYSEPWGKFIGSQAGVVSVSFTQSNSKKTDTKYLLKNGKELLFNYENINRPPEYKYVYYLSVSHRLGSIYFDGNYFLELRDGNKCQIFTQDVNNLYLTQFVIKNYVPNYIIIIPTK